MNWIMLPALAGIAALTAAPTPVNERSVTGDGVVTGLVNGVPGRIRIDPAAPSLPLLSQDLAERAGLRAGFIGLGYSVGSQKVTGRSAVGRIDLGAGAVKQRIGWTVIPYASGIEGVVGPGGVAEPVVRFVLGPSVPGEHTVAMKLEKQGSLFGSWGSLFATVDVGGNPIEVRFAPHQRRTLATAGAGARLAGAPGARIEGATVTEEIAFGIARPVRDLVLATPLAVGPFSITKLGVRVADEGSIASVPDADAPPADPDEVIVTGKGKRGRHRERIAIGADLLSACSSIVFDKPAKLIRLTCR